MYWFRILLPACLVLTGLSLGQEPTEKPSDQDRERRAERTREPGESSSRDSRIDLSPPKDDAKNHPNSDSSIEDQPASDVQEFHPWDPHRAAKDVEVGDFYFKRKNYHAAESRYREALIYKSNDAMATFGLAQCLDKLGKADEAREKYESYLKILPQGPRAQEAHKALDRLKNEGQKARK